MIWVRRGQLLGNQFTDFTIYCPLLSSAHLGLILPGGKWSTISNHWPLPPDQWLPIFTEVFSTSLSPIVSVYVHSWVQMTLSKEWKPLICTCCVLCVVYVILLKLCPNLIIKKSCGRNYSVKMLRFINGLLSLLRWKYSNFRPTVSIVKYLTEHEY